ncbi:MAG: hypothetical protein GXO27_00380 [Chlorobi bacterium]|nr:hypothetical protein [Chlorobiota bacterium]
MFFDFPPEKIFKLKEPAKISSLFNLNMELLESASHEDLKYLASLIGALVSAELEESEFPPLDKEKIEALAEQIFKAHRSDTSVSLDDIMPEDLSDNEKASWAVSLLFLLPAVLAEMASSADPDELQDRLKDIGKLYAVLFLFDDLYGTRFHDFIDAVYGANSEAFRVETYRNNLMRILAEPPRLFKE